MTKNILISVFLILFLVFFYRNRTLNTEYAEQSKRLHGLENEITRLEDQLADLSKNNTDKTKILVPVTVEAKPRAESFKEAPTTPTKVVSKFNQDYQSLERLSELSSIEKLVTLSESERKAIDGLIKADKLSDPESLEDILGEQKFKEYEKAKELFAKQVRDEQIENELFSLSRKLNLDKQQEAKIKEVIIAGKELYFPLNEKIDKNLSLKQRSIERVMRELERQAYNAAGLKEILSEEQYNSYLEVQATSAANQSHDSFLSTAQKEE